MPKINLGDEKHGATIECLIVCFDANGVEIPEPDGSLLTDEIFQTIKSPDRYDDVFLLSHGWQGDAIGAVSQYAEWAAAMHDSRMLNSKRFGLTPEYRPLLIGLHWPSRPIGDESFSARQNAFESGQPALNHTSLESVTVDTCAEGIVDTIVARNAYAQLLTPAEPLKFETSFESFQFPVNRWLDDIRSATSSIIQQMDIEMTRLGSRIREGGRDALSAASDLVQTAATLSGTEPSRESVVAKVVNLLSFYQMKERAHLIGETGASNLISQIMSALPKDKRVCLMGHSFGCIVVSSMLTHAELDGRYVNSVVLLQGALSIWSYSDQIIGMTSRGRYRAMLGKIRGPVITTQSSNDTAVGIAYPAAVSALDGERFKTNSVYHDYAGVGTAGVRGNGIPICDLLISPANETYNFQHGIIYNLQADSVICNGNGPSGAHCDIAKPEVANAVWQSMQSETADVKVVV